MTTKYLVGSGFSPQIPILNKERSEKVVTLRSADGTEGFCLKTSHLTDLSVLDIVDALHVERILGIIMRHNSDHALPASRIMVQMLRYDVM